MNSVFQGVVKTSSHVVDTAKNLKGCSSDKKVRKLIQEIELHSTAIVKEIADPNKRSVKKINETSQKLKNCEMALKKALKSVKADHTHSKNISESVETSLSSIKVAESILSFDQEFKAEFEQLEDEIGKIGLQSNWLRLGEDEISFTTETYAKALDQLKKLWMIYSQYSAHTEYPPSYHEYINGKLKDAFHLVQISLAEHSSYIQEKLPEILEKRKEEISQARIHLLQGGSEDIIGSYREFSEAVQKLQALERQFATACETLNKASVWIAQLRDNQGEVAQHSFLGAIVDSISKSLFRPSTAQEFITNVADHLKNDVLFYSDAHKTIKDLLSTSLESIEEVNHAFIQLITDQSGGSSQLLEYMKGLKDKIEKETLSYNEYVEIKKQFLSVEFLISTISVTDGKAAAQPDILNSLKSIRFDLKKSIESFEKKTGFTFSHETEVTDRLKLLSHRWEKDLIATEWSDTTKRVVRTCCKALQLYARIYKPAKVYRANLLKKTIENTNNAPPHIRKIMDIGFRK